LKEKKKEVELKKQASDVLLDEMLRQKSEIQAQEVLADKEKARADKAAEKVIFCVLTWTITHIVHMS
jgi:hypothetical protein